MQLKLQCRQYEADEKYDNHICEQENIKIINGDCQILLKKLRENSVDLVITDPPYFLDGLNDKWDDNKIKIKASKSGVIGGLPVGMKFDRKQGEKLQQFMSPIATDLYRVLKPGGFCIVFSQARLYHRMAISFDNAGFEIRDMLAWKYEGQAKAFSQAHFIRRDRSLSEAEKTELINELDGYKTPQLKPQMEPMVMAQKPKIGAFVENWRKYKLGLINTKESLDGRFPGNVMEVSKHERNLHVPVKIEHITVKPLSLIAHLIRLFTQKDHIVLDPFMGSGTHGVAAIQTGRKFIGFELETKYFNIVKQRLESINL